jgi:hypothetical protein
LINVLDIRPAFVSLLFEGIEPVVTSTPSHDEDHDEKHDDSEDQRQFFHGLERIIIWGPGE